jgi:hypothetical protein
MATKKSNRVAVLVTTSKNYVCFGYIDPKAIVPGKPFPATLKVEQSRCAIYWGTTKGLGELAATGPTSKSKCGAPMDVTLDGITAVGAVSKAAESAWLKS